MNNNQKFVAGPSMPQRNLSKISLLFFLAAFALSSCDSNNNDPIDPPAKIPSVTVGTSATLGTYLTDSLGNSLYSFANDFDGQNNCIAGCANVWPPFYIKDLTAASIGSGLDLADFATITNSAGTQQTTYKTWPLYYYAPLVGAANTRELPGEIKGEGIANLWNVAKPDYTIRLINAQLIGVDGKSYKSDYTEGAGKTLFFSDATGATLYHFGKDSLNKNKFTKEDFSNNPIWPIYETDKIVVPSTLDKTLFGSITVFGKKQLTYKGWPMYYFGADNKLRGSTKGVSVGFPGLWPVLVKDAAVAPQ